LPRAGFFLAADFFFADWPADLDFAAFAFRPPKMASQLSANFFVAPTRTTLMTALTPIPSVM